MQKKKSIAYCIESMFNSGGMEHVLTVCANFLCDDFDITIITAYQKGRKDYFPLNSQIKRIDIEAEQELKSSKDIIKEYKTKLSDFLNSNHFDIVVSMGGLNLYFLHSIKDGSKKIYWAHFSYDYYKYINGKEIKGRLLSLLQTLRRNFHVMKYEAVVVLSEYDLHKWSNITSKALLIYNPLTFMASGRSNLNHEKVIAVGRLDYMKGFDLLIDAWKLVNEKYPSWKLNIFGDGNQREALQSQINSNRLENVITLCGRTEFLEKEYIDSSIFVLSSRDEAFGLVIIEAESCGLPIVSFDIPSAKELINRNNGITVSPIGNIYGLAEAIIKLISDQKLRIKMGGNSIKNTSPFKVHSIKKRWTELFLSLH